MLKKHKQKAYNLTTAKILERTNDYTIFQHYIGSFNVGKSMKSVFREESNPSFIVRCVDSKLLYRDYGDDRYKGDCFNLVMQLFNLSFIDAMKKIDLDLNLGILNEQVEAKPIKLANVVKETKKKMLFVEEKEFSEEDLSYWAQYGLNKYDLIKNGICSVDRFFIQEEGKSPVRGNKTNKELSFGYKFLDEDNKHIGWKIYFPNRKIKWKSSVPNSFVEGLNDIKHFRHVIVTKSRKDRMVLSKICDNVVSVQNESKIFLTKDNINLLKNFKRVIIFYDADETGVRSCTEITSEYGWDYVNTPKHLIEKGIKDASDWVKAVKSFEPLKNFLSIKKIPILYGRMDVEWV